jgi:hypothetical protein
VRGRRYHRVNGRLLRRLQDAALTDTGVTGKDGQCRAAGAEALDLLISPIKVRSRAVSRHAPNIALRQSLLADVPQTAHGAIRGRSRRKLDRDS